MPGIDAYTKLLLHCNGTNGSTTFVDSSASAHTVTSNGGAAISTAQSKFGGASAYFDGTDDYLTIPDSADFDFGTDSFCIDFWLYYESGHSGVVLGTNGNYSYDIYISDQGRPQLYYYNSIAVLTMESNVPADSWSHVAFCKNNRDMYGFINGEQKAYVSNTDVSFNVSNGLCLGRYSSGASTGQLNMYVDELRISKGIARWTANFTPPDSEYSNRYSRYSGIMNRHDLRAARTNKLICAFNSGSYARTASVSARYKVGDIFSRSMAMTSDHSERSPRRAALVAPSSFRAGRSISATAKYTMTAGRLASLISSTNFRTARTAKLISSADYRTGRAIALTAEHNQFCRYGYNVYIDGSLAGFVDYENGARTLPGVALADGEHVIRIEPSRWLWQDAAYSEELRFTISAGELASKSLPAITGLSATDLVRGNRWISWTWSESFLTIAPESFGLWFSSTSPVDVSGTPNKTLTAGAANETHACRYAQSSAKYVAVAAMASGAKGIASELLLTYPTDTITSPDNQYITGAQS